MFLKWIFCTKKDPSRKCLFNLNLKRKIFWFKVAVSGTKICCRSPFIRILHNYQSYGVYSIEPWLVNHCWKFNRDPKIVLIFSSKVVTQGPFRKCTFSRAFNSLRPSCICIFKTVEWMEILLDFHSESNVAKKYLPRTNSHIYLNSMKNVYRASDVIHI